jgi:hypothetical protein
VSGGIGRVATWPLGVPSDLARERGEERVQQRQDHEHAEYTPNGRRNRAIAGCEQAADQQRRGGGTDDRRLG